MVVHTPLYKMALWWGRSFEGGAMTNAPAPRWPNHLNPGCSVATLKFDAALGLRAGPAGDLPWWRQSKREDAPSYTGQKGGEREGFQGTTGEKEGFSGSSGKMRSDSKWNEGWKVWLMPWLAVFVSELFILLILPTPWIGHIFIGCFASWREVHGSCMIMRNGGKNMDKNHHGTMPAMKSSPKKTHRKSHLPEVHGFSPLAA